jgi:hypothetical protein
VNIREYRPGFVETAASLSGPAAALYDYGAMAKLLTEYNLTEEAKSNRSASLTNSLLYLLSETIPGMREPKSFMKWEVKNVVKAEE